MQSDFIRPRKTYIYCSGHKFINCIHNVPVVRAFFNIFMAWRWLVFTQSVSMVTSANFIANYMSDKRNRVNKYIPHVRFAKICLSLPKC